MKKTYQEKTLWNFLCAIFMSVVLFVVISIALHYGLTDLLGLTVVARDALLCCRTLFSWCLVSPLMLKTVVPWVGIGIILAGFVRATWRAARAILISRRFLRSLHNLPIERFPEIRGLSERYRTGIIPFEDRVIRTAFTAGIFRPTVHISTGLMEGLTPEELRAVVLHEIHHAVNRDPLRLFVLSFIRDAFFFLPLGRYLMDSFHVHKELSADEGVVSVTGRPFDLATAILKMVRMQCSPIPAHIPAVGGMELVEKRVRTLLEDDTRRDRPPRCMVVLTGMVMAILVFTLVLPIHAGTQRMERCNHEYCLSGDRICPSDIDDCERACEEMEK